MFIPGQDFPDSLLCMPFLSTADLAYLAASTLISWADINQREDVPSSLIRRWQLSLSQQPQPSQPKAHWVFALPIVLIILNFFWKNIFSIIIKRKIREKRITSIY
jgi:hypothetical protein